MGHLLRSKGKGKETKIATPSPSSGIQTRGRMMQASRSPVQQTSALDSGLSTQIEPGPLSSFELFPKLPIELRTIVWALASGHSANYNAPRIIEVRFNQVSFVNPFFRMDSPPGPYQAPTIGRNVDSESRQLWTARHPDVLRLPGSAPIWFKASHDIIYLDARSLFILHEMDRRSRAPGAAAAQTQVPIGFTAIQNLATPLDNNNIYGMTEELLARATGPLRGVRLRPSLSLNRNITYVYDVPHAIETEQDVLNYYQARFNAQQAGNYTAYIVTRGIVMLFFTPNDEDDSDDDMGGEG